MTDAPSYRYLLCDLLTDLPLVDLPLTGVSFERRLCRVGSLSGTLEVANPSTAKAAKLLRDYAGRAALWVYRDGALWWGGIPWTVQAQQGQRGPVSLSVSAATFDSYAHRRIIRGNHHYLQTDQGYIMAHLWWTLQDDIRGDIGVQAVADTTGTVRDRSYYGHEQETFGKRIEELGDVEGGSEHTMLVYLDEAGNRVKEFRSGLRLGSETPTVVFQRALRGGGRVLDWGDVTDTVDCATTFQARGDAPNGNVGEDVAPLLSDVIERTDLLDAGWPLLDKTQDRSGVIEQATLDAWARVDAEQFGGQERILSYTVQVGNTGWNPNRLGENVRVKLADLWHDNSDVTVRPVGCKVSAAEKGQPETVELLLDGGDE